MPRLEIHEAGSSGDPTSVDVTDDVTTLGRGDAADVTVAEPLMSRVHLQIERRDRRWKVVDLETRNGTLVNGVCRNTAWLEDGDEVRVGDTTVVFDAKGGPASGAARAAAPARRPAAVGAPAAMDGEDGEWEEPLPRRRGSGGELTLILVLSTVAFAGLIGLVFLFGGGAAGTDDNQVHFNTAERAFKEGDYETALEHYLQIDQGSMFHPGVPERIEYCRTALSDEGRQGAEDAKAGIALANLRARYDLGERKSLVDDLEEFIRYWEGSKAVAGARELLDRIRGGGPSDPEAALAAARERAEEAADEDRFGDAMDALLKVPERHPAAGLGDRVEDLVDDLRARADTRWAEIRDQAAAAEPDEARALYQDVIDDFGIPSVVEEARRLLEALEE